MHDDDDTSPLTDAQRISQTRFGARPIPKGQRRMNTAEQEYRRIPPHGDVSPDGERIWPRPSATARLLVWGGTAAAAVAVTAGTALLLRRIGDALSSNTPHHGTAGRRDPDGAGRRDMGPRPRPQAVADPSSDRYRTARPHSGWQDEPAGRPRAPRPDARPERDWVHAATYERSAPDLRSDEYTRRPERAEASQRPRRRKPRNLIAEFEDNSRRMTRSVDGMVGSLGTAMTGFLSVARQAGTIMREFGDAADLVRNMMDSARKPAPGEPTHATRTEPKADADRRTHNL